jgi:hypothetical protein
MGGVYRDYRITGNYGTFEITKVVRLEVANGQALDMEEEDWEEEAWSRGGIMEDLKVAGWTFTQAPKGEDWEIERVI